MASRKSRRGLRIYERNPFIGDLLAHVKPRTKRLANSSGDSLMIVAEGTGEIVANAGFQTFYEVDQAQFVKLYVDGVKAFTQLSSAGTKVFHLLYLEVQKQIGAEMVYLHYLSPAGIELMSQRSFLRGVGELLTKGFIAESFAAGHYFVNPTYIYNGNRLTMAKTYSIAGKAPRLDTRALPLFDQDEPPALAEPTL